MIINELAKEVILADKFLTRESVDQTLKNKATRSEILES
jgi:hypothetical protein